MRRPWRAWAVAIGLPTSTRSTTQNSTSGACQSTSRSGAAAPTVTNPSSSGRAQTWRSGW
jgi:hypothetical protein